MNIISIIIIRYSKEILASIYKLVNWKLRNFVANTIPLFFQRSQRFYLLCRPLEIFGQLVNLRKRTIRKILER